MQIPISIIAAAIDGAIFKGKRNVLIKRIIADSREVKPGDLFVCVRGRQVDGHRFIASAIEKGASAILLERPVNQVLLGEIAVIKVNDVSKALKDLVPRFYNYPSMQLPLVGVTGTNGKTSITYMVRAIWDAQFKGKNKTSRVGITGTIRHEVAGVVIKALNTTPMAWDIQRLLGAMVDAKCQLAVMEVSSHALVENRIQDCELDIAVYTNLTREHLDYHGTMDHYAAAKRRLFTHLVENNQKKNMKVAVINNDDQYGTRMAKAARGAKLITYGLETPSDVTAKNIVVNSKGVSFTIKTVDNQVDIQMKLLGRYNIYNALAATAVGLALGLSLPIIKKGLERVKIIDGRMESIVSSQRFTVIVDYAHTPDALKQVLKASRELTKKRLILVFGCGGDRDSSKRGPMGSIAAALADKIYITSDNPRNEEPEVIIKQIIEGIHKEDRDEMQQREAIIVEVDRQKAIESAIRFAMIGDVVVIAGKGHESYQLIKDKIINFDDRKIARKALAKRRK